MAIFRTGEGKKSGKQLGQIVVGKRRTHRENEDPMKYV